MVAQTSGSTTTRSTQDLQAPLSQVLQTIQDSTRTSYVYGQERLVSLNGITRTWYGSDALGSIRQTLDSNGKPQSQFRYDPWGKPVTGNTVTTFGFTGEVQHPNGLTYLRARWYQPQHGQFLSRDPFAGFDTQPASLQPYQYVGNNPINLTDPSGECWSPIGWLRKIEGMNYHNMDMAIKIVLHPKASMEQRAVAASFITTVS